VTGEPELRKALQPVTVRFYRQGGIELMLVPLLSETAQFHLSAGDGYFMVVLLGEPRTGYPVNVRTAANLDVEYVRDKFRLRGGAAGYTGEEVHAALLAIGEDLANEERLDG
jgi:hypothetical protein